MPKLSFLSCFFPAYNEAENIGPLLDEALSTLPAFAERFEIIVVDDGSVDATAQIVSSYSAEHPSIRLVRHPRNLGYGQALRTGFKESRGDAVFFTDADRQFRLDEIDRLLGPFERAPIVIGYRIKRNDPWHRLIVAKVYHAVLHATFGLEVRDIDCAFKLIRREVLEACFDDLRSRSAFISPELVIRARNAGSTIEEVGVTHHPRTAGRPKGATPKVIARTIREIVRARRDLGQRSTRDAPGRPPR